MGLLEKLKSGKRNVREISFPGTDERVGLQILSNQDLQDAVFATEQHFKDKGVEVTGTTLDSYEDERTSQILFRALRNPDNPKEAFAGSVVELRKNLTRAEKDELVAAYNDFERECSPSFKQMSDAEFEALFEEIKKNPATLSSNSSFATLRGLISYLASRPST